MKRQELEALTVFELRKLARANKVVGSSGMKKDELVDALAGVRLKAPAAPKARAAAAKASPKAAPRTAAKPAPAAKPAAAKAAPPKAAPPKAAPPKATKGATPAPKGKAATPAQVAGEPTQKAIAALDELLARSHAAAAETPADDAKPEPARPAAEAKPSGKTPRPGKARPAKDAATRRPTEPPTAELPEQPPHEATHRLEAITADGSSPPPQEPAQMLDLAPLPDTYGIDVADLRARDPFWLLAHWEITPGRIADGHRLVGQDARLVLRLYAALEPHAPPIDDVILPSARGRWFLRAPAPGLSVRGQVGLRARDGRFVALCDTPAARVPHAEPAAMHDPVWMRVTPADVRVHGAAAGRPPARGPVPVVIDRVLYPYVPPVEEPAQAIRPAPHVESAPSRAMHVTPPPLHARPAVAPPAPPEAPATHDHPAPEPERATSAESSPSSPGHAWGGS